MIYTIGDISIYEPYIKNDKNAAKAKGGSVWETFEEAKDYCEMLNNKLDQTREYRVYAVDANWINDTEEYVEDKVVFRSLTRNAKLIKIGDIKDIFPWIK